ncbi:hypothetical protein APASM_5769 [Actinosynnema pretiosum subsp. pretiosum]|nr:hypothetical protein APASM_5769 [Actinosynnema pretiosum subsp. pretiosum]
MLRWALRSAVGFQRGSGVQVVEAAWRIDVITSSAISGCR